MIIILFTELCTFLSICFLPFFFFSSSSSCLLIKNTKSTNNNRKKMLTSAKSYAVEVVDLSFGYGKTNILEDVNLHVPKGQIYALLGPSGSGKTSLLRLILGRIQHRVGTIKVFGDDRPGYFNRIIGYMPQSQALSLELSVGETLDYFASIYQLDRKHYIKE